jgi:hypothetical protein
LPGAGAADAPAAAAGEFKTRFGPAGPESLSYNGQELLALGEGKLVANRIDFGGKGPWAEYRKNQHKQLAAD